MKNNNALKGLLAISAAAAMFATFGVQAQTATAQNPSTQKMTDANPSTQVGKTSTGTTAGMAGHMAHGQSGAGMSASTSSTGIAQNPSTQKMTDATPSNKVGQSGAGMSGSTGTGATGMSGTAAGTMKMNKADSKAIMDMAMVNMAEVEMGKMAQSKSQNAEVKTFAQQMIDDHTKGLAEVQTVAQAKGITLPTELDAKHKAMAAKLAKLEGEKFDREYMKMGGTGGHKEALAMLNKNEKNAKDADVKGLATKMKPTVEQHLKAAQQMPAAKPGTTSGK